MKILTINPLVQPKFVDSIVDIYQQSFGYAPWHEGYRCPICETVQSLEFPDSQCPACAENGLSVLLAERWPRSQVLSDFYCEMRRDGAICHILLEEASVIGFAWGYAVIGDVFCEELSLTDTGNVLSGKFFYLDEIAITPSRQHRGFGGEMLTIIKKAHPRILLRTLNNSPMFHLITREGGIQRYSVSGNRVIMTLER